MPSTNNTLMDRLASRGLTGSDAATGLRTMLARLGCEPNPPLVRVDRALAEIRKELAPLALADQAQRLSDLFGSDAARHARVLLAVSS